MKIDVFAHILPKRYAEGLRQKSKAGANVAPDFITKCPPIGDLDVRLRLMDRYPDVLQVLTVATPPLEDCVSADDAIELARIANDEMAELVAKYPDRFVGAVACLPLSNIDAAMNEADRALRVLRFRGVQIFTNIDGEPLDAPRFRPLYQRMAQCDLPIWLHPWYPPGVTPTPKDSPVSGRHEDHGLRWPFESALGWPMETTLAMVRLASIGIFADFPDIKFITHHGGGMLPFFDQRVASFLQSTNVRMEHLRKFYNDTALYGSTGALMCAHAFSGADHLVFGTDAPLGSSGWGYGRTQETIRSVERMDIPESDKDKIFVGNAIRLLKLAV